MLGRTQITRIILTTTLIALLASTASHAESLDLAAKLESDKVSVTLDGKLVTCYKFDHSQKYPYFWPVNGPASNKSITTETTEPYPHHHSLFFGCDRVNGGNYWQDVNKRGQILSQGPRLMENSGPQIIIADTCLWKQPDKDPIIRDHRRITITAPDRNTRIIDFAIALEALTEIEILKTNHSLFSARVVPALSVKSGGTLVNARGDRGEKGTWGVASPWCDYYGTRNGCTEGIAILQHPSNRWFPSKWFTRDYGFFSPTPMYWLDGGKFHMARGDILPLSYRVVVHAGDTDRAGIREIYDAYRRTPFQPPKTKQAR